MQHPTRVGKYEVEEFLGGGMARVYRARDQVLGRRVALKILSDSAQSDSEAKARFLHEARTASSISHENIIAVYDFGEEQGRPFMVMEFLEGESLRDAIKNSRTGDLTRKMEIALQVARAIEHIHSKKIIHRDIKPENIHVDHAGHVKLMDFGIAKADGVSLTRTGFTLGTPFYMAPEQVLGQPLTAQADIYSFGVLLFELLSGTKPVSGETFEQIFHQILEAPIPLDRLKAQNVPPAAIYLISRCMVKQPAGRLEDLTTVCDSIEEILKSLRPGTVPPTKPQRRPSPAPQIAAQSGDLPAFLRWLPGPLRTPAGLALISAAVTLAVVFAVLRLAHVI